MQRLREHIQKIVLLSDEEFEFISSHFTARKYKKHQFLIQEGEPARHHFFILSGLMKLVYTDDTAKEHIVSFAMEDWWESDFLAFYTQTPSTMSLICLEDTEVLCLTLESYRNLCEQSPKMEKFFLEKANFGFLGAQRRIIALLTSNAKQRYEQLLKLYPVLVQRVPKSQLAAYLGVSRETLSRF